MSAPITVAIARGLGEKYHDNLLWNLVRPKLDPRRFRVVEVQYSPAFGFIGGQSPMTDQALWAGVEEAVADLDRITRDAPGPVVTSGYSFGTLPTNEHVKRNRGNGKIVLSANLASARRKPGRSYGLAIPATLGGGIFGDYVDDPRLWAEIAWVGDVVTNLPPQSLIRQGASLIRWMSLPDIPRWGADVAAQLPGILFGALMDGRAPEAISDTVRSIPLVDGYARLGQHTTAYSQPHWRDWQGKPISGLDLLARVINGVKA